MDPNSEMRPQREYPLMEAARLLVGVRFDHGPGSRLFDTLPWFEMLHGHCFPDRPVHLAYAEGEVEGCALLPLTGDATRMDALSNWYSFSYGPLLPSTTVTSKKRMLALLAAELRGETRQIQMFPVLDEEGLATELVRAFRGAGWLVFRTPQSLNHCVRTQGRSFAQYWNARPEKLQNTVRRKSKGSALRFEVHDTVTDALWQDYEGIYAASWKTAEPFPAFLRALADDATRRGTLRLGFARIDGRAVATQFWTIDGGIAHIHKLAHDEAVRTLSPGTLLSHHMFARAFDTDRVSMIDYGTGDNSYKREWMEETRTMYRIDCFDPRYAALWWPAAKTLISRLVGRRNAG